MATTLPVSTNNPAAVVTDGKSTTNVDPTKVTPVQGAVQNAPATDQKPAPTNQEDRKAIEETPLPAYGILGPNSQYVVLVSSDFHEFVVRRQVACASPTIRRILEARVKEIKPTNVCEIFVNYPSMVVGKVMDYLVYKEFYERTRGNPPEFKVEPDLALEVLMACQFFDV